MCTLYVPLEGQKQCPTPWNWSYIADGCEPPCRFWDQNRLSHLHPLEDILRLESKLKDLIGVHMFPGSTITFCITGTFKMVPGAVCILHTLTHLKIIATPSGRTILLSLSYKWDIWSSGFVSGSHVPPWSSSSLWVLLQMAWLLPPFLLQHMASSLLLSQCGPGLRNLRAAIGLYLDWTFDRSVLQDWQTVVESQRTPRGRTLCSHGAEQGLQGKVLTAAQGFPSQMRRARSWMFLESSDVSQLRVEYLVWNL